MTVHFVYRSAYDGPIGTCLYVKRFDEPSILDWFRKRWRGISYDDGAPDYAEEELGTSVYGFSSIFNAIAEEAIAPPRSHTELHDFLHRHLCFDELIFSSPHLMQALTSYDEIQIAYYFFDDDYLAKNCQRTALLLNDGWQLPTDVGEGGFRPTEKTALIGKARGEGATYLVFHRFFDSLNLDDLEGGFRIDGIRLPQLVQHLARHDIPKPKEGCGFTYDLPVLVRQLHPKAKKAKSPEDPFLFAIRENPDDDAPWLMFNDWLQERGGQSAGAFILERALRGVSRYAPNQHENSGHNWKKSFIQVDEHVSVFCRHVGVYSWPDSDLYHQWYFFDDLWGSAHPDLANAILRFASRWDVL